MPIQPATLGVGSSLPPRFQGVSDDELVMAFHRLAAGVLITVFVTVTGPHAHQTPDLPTIGAGLYLLAGLAILFHLVARPDVRLVRRGLALMRAEPGIVARQTDLGAVPARPSAVEAALRG